MRRRGEGVRGGVWLRTMKPHKKKSFVRHACSVGVLCSMLALLWFPSCVLFEACSNDPCNDGVYCNGPETCTIDGNLNICHAGVSIECDEGMVCDEEARACVAE